MQDETAMYQTEITELKEENMYFTVENQKPLNTDVNVQRRIEEALFLIFEKYGKRKEL